MHVKIYSRQAIEPLIHTGFPDGTAVISFYDPPGSAHVNSYNPVEYPINPDHLFQVAVYDIDLSVLPQFGLTYDTYFPEADSLAEFIYAAKQDNLDIICQCEYGESRSSGCAAAILEHFYNNGISVFADYRYYPNQVIYHKVYDALQNLRNLKIPTK